MNTLLLTHMLNALIAALGPALLRHMSVAVLEAVEALVRDSETKTDDKVLLPLLAALHAHLEATEAL